MGWNCQHNCVPTCHQTQVQCLLLRGSTKVKNKTHAYTQKQWSTNYTRGTHPCFIHAVTSDIGNHVDEDTKEGRWHYKQQLSSSGQWWQLSQCVVPSGPTRWRNALFPPLLHGQGVLRLACTLKLRVTVIKNNMVKTFRAEWVTAPGLLRISLATSEEQCYALILGKCVQGTSPQTHRMIFLLSHGEIAFQPIPLRRRNWRHQKHHTDSITSWFLMVTFKTL